MSSRLSRLSIEEFAGVVLLALAVVALAANTGAIEKALVGRTSPAGGPVGIPSLARDAEDQRMRLVLALGRGHGGSTAPRVIIPGDPCAGTAPLSVTVGMPPVVCLRLGSPMTPR